MNPLQPRVADARGRYCEKEGGTRPFTVRCDGGSTSSFPARRGETDQVTVGPRGSALLLPQFFDVELKIAPSRAWHVGVKKTAIGVW